MASRNRGTNHWTIRAAAVLVVAAGTGRNAAAAMPERLPVVYAAASLTSAMQALIDTHAAAAGLTARLSFASSSTLARQIEAGAPASLFISANQSWMDYLEERDLLEPGTRVDLLANRLVLIAPRDQPVTVRMDTAFDLAEAFLGRLALGDPDHVPAGMYARQALVSMGWWEPVAGRLAPAPDVRTALMYVVRGQCALGIVYATDAAASAQVQIVGRFASGTHDPVVYPAAIVRGRASPAARRLLGFFASETAAAVFARYGFGARTAAAGPPGRTDSTHAPPAAADPMAPPPR